MFGRTLSVCTGEAGTQCDCADVRTEPVLETRRRGLRSATSPTISMVTGGGTWDYIACLELSEIFRTGSPRRCSAVSFEMREWTFEMRRILLGSLFGGRKGFRRKGLQLLLLRDRR
jgi:hypothetical protein